VSDLSVLILTQELFILFSSPVLLRKRSERVAGWAPGSHPRLTHHNTSVLYKLITVLFWGSHSTLQSSL